MTKVVFYKDENLLNPGRKILAIIEDSVGGKQLFDTMEKCMDERPKLHQWFGDEREYYPNVFVCIDGKDYLIKGSKFIEEEK